MKRIYQKLVMRRIVDLAEDGQMEIIDGNTVKHLKIMLVLLIALPFLAFLKLAPLVFDNHLLLEMVGVVDPTNLTAVIMVMGTAWFVITFGAVPKKLELVAMDITFWLFLGFTLSLEWMIVFMIIDSPLSAPFLLLIFWAVYVSAVQYDTMDALKAGLDEAQLRFTRLGRIIYRRQLGDEADLIEEGESA